MSCMRHMCRNTDLFKRLMMLVKSNWNSDYKYTIDNYIITFTPRTLFEDSDTY